MAELFPLSPLRMVWGHLTGIAFPGKAGLFSEPPVPQGEAMVTLLTLPEE